MRSASPPPTRGRGVKHENGLHSRPVPQRSPPGPLHLTGCHVFHGLCSAVEDPAEAGSILDVETLEGRRARGPDDPEDLGETVGLEVGNRLIHPAGYLDLAAFGGQAFELPELGVAAYVVSVVGTAGIERDSCKQGPSKTRQLTSDKP